MAMDFGPSFRIWHTMVWVRTVGKPGTLVRCTDVLPPPSSLLPPWIVGPPRLLDPTCSSWPPGLSGPTQPRLMSRGWGGKGGDSLGPPGNQNNYHLPAFRAREDEVSGVFFVQFFKKEVCGNAIGLL